jgi:hypothetical protein
VSITTPQAYYYANDHELTATGTQDSAGVYLNSATVIATMIDAATAVEVPGQTWPLTLSYVADSDGDYSGVIEYDLAVVAGQRLLLLVTVNAGVGARGNWEIPVLVRARKE